LHASNPKPNPNPNPIVSMLHVLFIIKVYRMSKYNYTVTWTL